MSASSPHTGAAASGGLAAAIAMAIAQIAFLATGSTAGEALAIGASLASIAFGFTYASIFFVSRARQHRTTAEDVSPSRA